MNLLFFLLFFFLNRAKATQLFNKKPRSFTSIVVPKSQASPDPLINHPNPTNSGNEPPPVPKVWLTTRLAPYVSFIWIDAICINQRDDKGKA